MDLENESGSTALQEAAEQGNVKMARALLNVAADVNHADAKQNTPLHRAAMHGKTECIDLLISHGAHIDARTDNQSTSVLLAALMGHLDALRILLHRSADPHLPDFRGSTPLMRAVQWGHVHLVRILGQLSDFEQINKTDKDGRTPLMSACSNDFSDVAQALIELGAYPGLPNKDGLLPLTVCGPCTLAVLTRHGADVRRRRDGRRAPINVALDRAEKDAAGKMGSSERVQARLHALRSGGNAGRHVRPEVWWDASVHRSAEAEVTDESLSFCISQGKKDQQVRVKIFLHDKDDTLRMSCYCGKIEHKSNAKVSSIEWCDSTLYIGFCPGDRPGDRGAGYPGSPRSFRYTSQSSKDDRITGMRGANIHGNMVRLESGSMKVWKIDPQHTVRPVMNCDAVFSFPCTSELYERIVEFCSTHDLSGIVQWVR